MIHIDQQPFIKTSIEYVICILAIVAFRGALGLFLRPVGCRTNILMLVEKFRVGRNINKRQDKKYTQIF